MKKSGGFNRFMKKMRFKYRVSILNENTLEESYAVRLSRFTVFLYGTSFAIITFFILTFIILYTPLRYYLPGYGDSVNRSAVVKESLRADSLLDRIEQQTIYIKVVQEVLSGNLKADSVPVITSQQQVERTLGFMEKSKAEKKFVEKMENQQKEKPQ